MKSGKTVDTNVDFRQTPFVRFVADLFGNKWRNKSQWSSTLNGSVAKKGDLNWKL